MLTLPEEILLLVLDDETGRFANPVAGMHPGAGAGPLSRSFALAGAVLMELALRSKIDTDPNQLVIVDAEPTGDALLDHYLARIAEGETKDAGAWVFDLSQDGAAIEETALDRLVERGILRRVEKRVLWVFKTRRYPMVDGVEEREVRTRMLELLKGDEIPSPHDVVLVSLADACALFVEILGDDEAQRLAPRIRQIGQLDLIGQAVARSMESLRLELAKAAMTIRYV